MKKIILFSLLCCFLLLGFSQTNPDSLWAVWHDEEIDDTSRLGAIHQIIIKGFFEDQLDSSLYYAHLEFDFAEASQHKKWMAIAKRDQGILYKKKNDFDNSLRAYKKALKGFEELEDKENIGDALINIGNVYYYLGNTEKAIEYCIRGEDICKVIGAKRCQAKGFNSTGVIYRSQGKYSQALNAFKQEHQIIEELGEKNNIAGALINIGLAYYEQGDNENAIAYYTRGAEICQEIGNKRYLATAFNNTGLIYNIQGNYVLAIEYLTKSLKIREEIPDNFGIFSTLVNIGNIYRAQPDYPQALKYYLKGLKIAEEMGNKRAVAGSIINIGEVYRKEGDHEKAQDFFNRGVTICKEIGEKPFLANAYSNRAFFYQDIGDFHLAIENQLLALQIYQELGNKSGASTSLNHLGKIAENKGDYTKAISYHKQSLAFAQELGSPWHIEKGASSLYRIYSQKGQYKQALEMHELHISMRDSLNSEANQKAVIQQQYKYEYEKRALADSLEQDKKELRIQLAHEAEVRKESNIKNISIGVGLLILLIAIALWVRNRFVHHTNRQLASAKDRAERSERAKEQFLANMSHEIRTPMHAISGMIKILERNDHPKAQKIFLDAMHKSSDNLIVLLNDILDLSKIEAGKLDVENIPMRPAEVLGTVEQILQFKAEEKSLAFAMEIDESVPTWVMSDPTRLNQILTNLAGNAIKFTEKGSVSIFAKKKGDFLLYEVRDTGIGIAEDKLHRIFDAFEQAEGSTARRFGGTGLGLNISRQLVELMGGNIWAESEVGKGSSFFVSLPLVAVEGDIADKQSLSEEQIMEMGAALSGKRILLAEDNEFNQMIAADDLEYYAHGIQVDIVENGALALEKAKTGLYDLILMDVQMPEMDGVEASLKIREWEQANDKSPIPIIAMTASLLKSEVNLCLEAGMDNYIPKPYQAEELVGRMYEEVHPSQQAKESHN